ncbi:hypothetical protein ACOQFV_12285 [Nocardiopsis changdeensis]|uniref:Uncharacterized protein n=1 Tax=Nocardiopsis changdeensis TaxID=2831969 RepID=A0ABX8BQ00_9ACTN|nr:MULTISPECIES: hypothetical protein [Nocardiopsis]QUX24315.1 hypothetical protein KGD84_08540 [Nocardiopsis changdeensis]QYX34706.1 hypothetical protein K1J57_18000 [Nocardiopsis sp. MT53]
MSSREEREGLEGREAALAAFDRSVDAVDLAVLVAERGPRTEEVRSVDDPVVGELSFEFGDVRIDLALHARGPSRTLSGTVRGDFGYALLEAHRPGGGEDVASVEETGEFALPDLRRGPIRLTLRRDAEAPLSTEWFTL